MLPTSKSDRWTTLELTAALRAAARVALLLACTVLPVIGAAASEQTSKQAPAESSAGKSIAVLPFAVAAPGNEQEYLSEIIAEGILNLLARAPELKVIARTSSFAFRGRNVPVAEIASQLDVAHVLEGSVRRSGDTVTITAQLIQAASGTRLWNQTYERPLADIFTVQEEMAGAIAQLLQLRIANLKLGSRDGSTRNLEAYRLYLSGMQANGQNTKQSLASAGEYLEQAVKLDPGFGRGWSGLAWNVVVKTTGGILASTDGYERARKLSLQAAQLSPDLAEAHADLVYIYRTFDRDWEAAGAEVQRGLAIDPTNPHVLHMAGLLAGTLGQWDDAEQKLQAVLIRDPLNPLAIANLGTTYYRAGRFADSERMFRKVLELAPGFRFTRAGLGKTLLAQGKVEEGLVLMEQDSDEEFRLAFLPSVLHAAGRRAEADKALEAQIAHWADRGAFYVAASYAYRGDRELAMQWLDRAYRQKDPALALIVGESLLRNLADEPRFKAFLRTMKLPEASLPAS